MKHVTTSILSLVVAMTLASVSPLSAQDSVLKLPNRPVQPGMFSIELRDRIPDDSVEGGYKIRLRSVEWAAAKTAIIICDMWDGHYCQSAAPRVDEMAPRMNALITRARNHGAMIVHSPSGTMDVYKDTPYRLRMIQAEHHEPPFPLNSWCYANPENEPRLPINDQNSPCDDPVVGEAVRRFSKQHDGIKIIGYDGITDRGQEVFNFFQQEGITNVVLMGVHTNMCVLGRPFGLRQMKKLDMNVALARDLTDAMYDPREYPYVSHTRGTELVIEHIEKYVCPSIDSGDLAEVIPGSNDPITTEPRPADKRASR